MGNLFIKCLKQLPGGFAPLAPLPGLSPGPTGALTAPDPRPIILHPPFLIPGFGPATSCVRVLVLVLVLVCVCVGGGVRYFRLYFL